MHYRSSGYRKGIVQETSLERENGYRRRFGKSARVSLIFSMWAACHLIEAQTSARATEPMIRFNAVPASVASEPGTPAWNAAGSNAMSTSEVPDAPGQGSSAQLNASVVPVGAGAMFSDSFRTSGNHPVVAPLYEKYIEPDETAQALSARDKFIFGFRQEVTFYFPLTLAAAAGYEQALNGSPNYGTNFRAYGQRVGAAAARNASQTIFEDSIMSPVLREDPRYYVLGEQHNAFARTAYAISRVLVTRTDSGHATPNFALFAGYAGAAGLTNAYYPPGNQAFSETAKSFGGSLGGAAISNVIREFLPGLLRHAGIGRLQ